MNDERASAPSQWLLFAILGLTLVKGILWSAAIPAWQAPDEPTHFALVQFIAEFGRLPGPNDTRMSEEARQSINLLELWQVAFHPEARQQFSEHWEGPNEAAIRGIPFHYRIVPARRSRGMHLPPLHHIIGTLAYRLAYRGDILTRVFAVRQVSVLLAVITVWLAYRTTRIAFPDNPAMEVTVSIVVSFHPMFTFMGAAINTDISLITLASWATYLLVLIVRSGLTALRAAGLGLAFGLGVLTKPQIWFLLPPLAMAALLEFLRRRVRVRRALLFAGLFVIVCTSVAGWSVVRNQILNENIFYSPRRSDGTPELDANLAEYLWTYDERLGDFLFRSYWGVFGWADTPVSYLEYYLLRLAVRVALVGLAVYAGKVVVRRHLVNTDWSLLIHGSFTASLIVGFAILGFWNYRLRGGSQPSQGRYFLAPLVGQMTLLTVGLLALLPRRLQGLGHLVLQVGMMLLNVNALVGALIPRYYVP